jgi:hypothetical protein
VNGTLAFLYSIVNSYIILRVSKESSLCALFNGVYNVPSFKSKNLKLGTLPDIACDNLCSILLVVNRLVLRVIIYSYLVFVTVL